MQTTARVWGDIWHVDDHVATILRDQAFRSRDVYDYSLVDWLYGPVRADHAAVVDDAAPASLAVPPVPATPAPAMPAPVTTAHA
ncbi:hypothetical protein [Georgenia muralis]|uniref:hypothetical protein n=1 Tax=Georgenia muralis TaxID=154117 RepID=UPI001B87432D|nr:hypothetical protein [Georgenia muralis]